MRYFELMSASEVDQIIAFKQDQFGIKGFIILKSEKNKNKHEQGPIFISEREDENELLKEALERASKYDGAIIISTSDKFSSQRKTAFTYLGSVLETLKRLYVIQDKGILEKDMEILRGVTGYVSSPSPQSPSPRLRGDRLQGEAGFSPKGFKIGTV